MPSSPTNFHGHSRFIALWITELEMEAEDETSMHWLKEEVPK
jgi:hypothetical protein